MIAYSKKGEAVSSIYVLLTDTDTIFTRIIKKYTSAPYNHASLALDKELNRLFSFGRRQANKPLSAGFVKEDIYAGTYRRYPNTQCALLRLNVTEEQYDLARYVVHNFQMKKDSYSYNLIGLLGIPLKINLTPKDSYFCSQFVAEVLRNLGLLLWEQPSIRVTPNDFLIHPSFEKVYEGLLYEFPLLDQTNLVNADYNNYHDVQLRKKLV